MRTSSLRLLVALLGLPTASFAAGPTYWEDVRPVLRKHCTVCHSEKNRAELDVSGGLALDSLDSIRKGSKRPVALSGKGSESPLVKVLRLPKAEERMPPDSDPLPDGAVAILKAWIDAGMPEGTRPVESGTNPTPPSKPRRKADVVIASSPLPKAVARPGQTAPLEVVLPVGPLAPVVAVTFSPDGRFLATGGYGRVVVWDLKEARVTRVLTNVLGAVNDLRFSPDGSLLAVAGGQPSARGDIRLFTTTDWKLTGSLGRHADVVGSVSFSPDGSLLASASFDKTARVWNLSTRESVMTYTGHSDFVHAVAFGSTGEWIATASKDRTGRLVDVKTGESRVTFSGTDQEVLAVAVAPDGTTVVTAGLDPSLSWWNSQTAERTKRTAGHATAVHELAVSPHGDILASAGADRSVRLWNTKGMDALRTIPVGSMVYAVALTPNGKQVATGSFDGVVRVYDTASGKLLGTLMGVSDTEWLAIAPEGFTSVSDGLRQTAHWRSGKAAVPADWVWKAVQQPGTVAKGLAGEKVGEPAFAEPQP